MFPFQKGIMDRCRSCLSYLLAARLQEVFEQSGPQFPYLYSVPPAPSDVRATHCRPMMFLLSMRAPDFQALPTPAPVSCVASVRCLPLAQPRQPPRRITESRYLVPHPLPLSCIQKLGRAVDSTVNYGIRVVPWLPLPTPNHPVDLFRSWAGLLTVQRITGSR